MARVIVLGAGIGGLPAAYELRHALDKSHAVTLINPATSFQFTPSNPWVAVGWRTPEQISIPIQPPAEKQGIEFIAQSVRSIDADKNTVELDDGRRLAYDFLVIATGPKLAFDEVPGLGPQGHTVSICTTPHAEQARLAYEKFLAAPGPVVIGAAAGASCFGPAYEFALILDADLRKRKLRHKVPMTFVTPEPYIGHMGLGGVGDSKGLLEGELRQRHIKWLINSKVVEVSEQSVRVEEHFEPGKMLREHILPQKFSMFIPAFKGIDAVSTVPDLCNPRGFVLIDEYQRNPKHRNIYAAGVCVAIPPVEQTIVATGAPKTGYMIESMVTALVANIKAELTANPVNARATWNAICLADMGDTGVAFVALPQIPPRNVTWAKKGKWVHLAKIAFEKYFLRKMRTGNPEPLYEKYVLKLLGILRVEKPT